MVDSNNPRHVTIIGLVSNIHSLDERAYPLLYRELCVFLVLTEGRAKGDAKIVCTFEETGQLAFETPIRKIEFGDDPLEVHGISFRIRDCCFPWTGLYSVQFWYDGIKLEERVLRLR